MTGSVNGESGDAESANSASAGPQPDDANPAAFSELTTLRVGGAPERMLVATTEAELVDTVRRAWAEEDHWMVLGGGSNTLMGDDGFDGAVVLVRSHGIEQLESDVPGEIRLRVQAGENWDELVAHTVANGWSGIEALSGIPGSVGAAPIQNIGAYGQEVSSSLMAIDLLDYDSGEVVRVRADDLKLGYRTSVLKRHGGELAEREGVVIAVELKLTDAATEILPASALGAPIAYAQLAFALGVDLGERVSIEQVRTTVLALRSSKGMVLDERDHDTWSAGSFFTNPIVSEQFARQLPMDAPRWPLAEEVEQVTVIPLDGSEPVVSRASASGPRLVKLSAAWLIENAGIRRGFHLPGSGAGISTKHTLALTNRGGATADDVASLARYVQARVQSEFGVFLVPEPVVFGVEL